MNADLAAHSLLKRRLREALPDAGWLSEETVDYFERLSRRSLLVIDPIDGTRGLRPGDPRWAASAALVIDGRPVPASSMRRRSMKLMRPHVARAGPNGAAIDAAAGWPPRSAAGPKPIIEAMAADLGAAVEIVPRAPSLADRLCMAARGASISPSPPKIRTIGTSRPPIFCSRRRAGASLRPPASGSSKCAADPARRASWSA